MTCCLALGDYEEDEEEGSADGHPELGATQLSVMRGESIGCLEEKIAKL